MKASSLKGIAVVDLSTAEKLGNVSKLILDPNNRRLLGLEIKSGRFSAPQVVRIDKVRSFGKDAITIDNSSGLNERANFPELRDFPGLGDVTGTRVVTQSGTLLGDIKDIVLSDDGQSIVEYEYSKGGLGSLVGLGIERLPATPEQRFGKDILTVPDAQGAHREQAEGQETGAEDRGT